MSAADQRLFGLCVRSNRPIPFAPPATAAQPDVVCALGEMRDIAGARCISYPDGTEFAVTRDAIAMTWRDPLDFNDACTYLVGPPFALLLRLRGVACLHASCVTFRGRTIAFVGSAGSGKSTTAAAMLLDGATLVAEDMLPITRSEGGVVALPGYAGIRLWPDSVELLMGRRDALPNISGSWDKRMLPVDAAQFATEPRPIDELRFFDDLESPLTPREAVLRLVGNSYHPELLDAESRANEFALFTDLADRTPARTVTPCSISSAMAR